MAKELKKAQDIFINGINQVCNKFGLNNIMAQLYAILYLSDKPLSLDEMVERLKISKGSVSVNIRALERYGVARRVWVKGSRRDYYEAETDISKVIMDRFKSMAQSRLSEVGEMINASFEAISSLEFSSEEDKRAMVVFKERLNKLKDLQRNAKYLYEMLKPGLLNGVVSDNMAPSIKKISQD